MSRSVNLVILLGNLGADPEVRAIASGTRVAELSLATEHAWNDRAGKRQVKVEWHRIVAWGPLAEIVERFAKKGTQLHVQGRIQYRSYEDRNGVTKWTTEIVATEISLLSGGRAQPAREEQLEPSFVAGEQPAEQEQMPFDELPSDPQPITLDSEESVAVATATRTRRRS